MSSKCKCVTCEYHTTKPKFSARLGMSLYINHWCTVKDRPLFPSTNPVTTCDSYKEK